MRYLHSLTLLLMVGACGVLPADRNSEVATHLGAIGNKEMRKRFNDYQAKSEHCPPPSHPNERRVLVTGFGLFSYPPINPQREPFNLSGVLAATAVEANVGDGFLDHFAAERLASQSHLRNQDRGARLRVGHWRAEYDTPVTVCSLVLTVQWDLAAAIILAEAQRFVPESILMMGLGGRQSTVVLETGALNRASVSAGFDEQGRLDGSNFPEIQDGELFPAILPSRLDPPDSVSLTWNAHKAAQLLNHAIAVESLEWVDGFSVATGASSQNDYICNNVAYLVRVGAMGQRLELANGAVQFDRALTHEIRTPETPMVVTYSRDFLNAPPTVGFMHVPLRGQDDRSSIQRWQKMLRSAELIPASAQN